jgi:Terminase small subunit
MRALCNVRESKLFGPKRRCSRSNDRKKPNFTNKQCVFISRYLVSLNAERAAREAGFKGARHGYKLLQIPKIRAEIAHRLGGRLKRDDLTAERTLEEIRRLAMSDITDVLDDEGKLVSLKDLPEDVRACISEIRFNEEGIPKSVKFWPKPHAIHLAATHLRLLVELSEQKTSLEIRIREMTPDQRKQYAIELLDKARTMLPIQVIAAEVGTEPMGIGSSVVEADERSNDEATI